MKNILVVMGTRPEVIKLAMVAKTLMEYPNDFHVEVLLTGQHMDLADSMLPVFDLQPAHRLDIMKPNQTLNDVTIGLLEKIEPVLTSKKPDLVIVQGDTTTSFAAALAAFYQKIRVAHVEAGLRTGEKYYPFPEEINRRLISELADIHYPPTEMAENALQSEGLKNCEIVTTGNTVIDALEFVMQKNAFDNAKSIDGRRQILVTMHRRENFGEPMLHVCGAIDEIIHEHDDVDVLFPVHPNPNVRQLVYPRWENSERIKLCDPLDYVDFIQAMASSYLIMSDSGGVQEEAPSLNKPVLVLRGETERMEGVDAGVTALVGTETKRIVETANKLLNDEKFYASMSEKTNPYGDGKACVRIAEHLRQIEL